MSVPVHHAQHAETEAILATEMLEIGLRPAMASTILRGIFNNSHDALRLHWKLRTQYRTRNPRVSLAKA